MDFMDEIFKRMDLRQVGTFLLDGTDDLSLESDTYKNRLYKGKESIYKRLESVYKTQDELDKALGDLSEALNAYEAVYTEIGMKFAARLIFQLLHKDNFT